jgi:hypothetical protein
MAGSVLFLKLLCLLKVQEFLATLVLKVRHIAKLQNVSGNLNQQTDKDKQTDKCGQKNS